MKYQYHYHRQPGCGGCLLVAALILLLSGGAPLLIDVIGLLLAGGVFLFLALLVATWAFTYYIRRKVSQYEQGQTEARNNFVALLVQILVKIAQFDGNVTREELQTIKNFFRSHLHYTQNQMFWVNELIKDAIQNTESLEASLEQFKSSFAYEPRLILVELVYQVIFSNDRVSDQDLELARNIAEYLELSPYDLQTIQSRYVHRRHAAVYQERNYYDVLGLNSDANFEEIKKAYRKLSMKYHPDKVGHLGEEFKGVAEEKMKEINAAYQHLKKKFN
ncbi:MAG: DnaJ domain-containing protein [Deltaproteobacteria bacterium]|nr:DnaJ domain-containing protein [Deltaproteobacteria bacterium]